jgi:glycosyltransferase involved in cell wall biosynthesis
MLSLGIVICTYQRPEKLRSLIKNILHADPLPQEIIVVDASPETYQAGIDEQGVQVIKSNHANQPYQRYVGYLAAKSDLLLYLDDDMEIVHPNFINVILNIFIQRPQISGVALHFTNKQLINALSDIPTSNLFRKNGIFKRLKNKMSGYPDLPAGQLGWCGNRGPQPSGGGFTQWLSGGAFVAKRNCLYQNFNFQLFDLFEQKREWEKMHCWGIPCIIRHRFIIIRNCSFITMMKTKVIIPLIIFYMPAGSCFRVCLCRSKFNV